MNLITSFVCMQKGEKMDDKYGYIGTETLLDFCKNSKDHAITPNDFMRMSRVQIPSAQQEPKTGEWVLAFEGNSIRHQCSQCGTLYPNANGYNYCPNCSADMRGGEQK